MVPHKIDVIKAGRNNRASLCLASLSLSWESGGRRINREYNTIQKNLKLFLVALSFAILTAIHLYSKA